MTSMSLGTNSLEHVFEKAKVRENEFYEINLGHHIDMFVILSGDVYIERINAKTASNLSKGTLSSK